MLRFSPCKINIGLDIVAKRPDGYHDIVTAMVPVPWHDIVEIIPADGPDTVLTVLGRPVDCPPEKNLVVKAFRAMETLFGLPPVEIVLQKIIPDGAGLGGGSADAATTILILNDLFHLGLPKADISQIAAKIGADCPFFIYDEPMLCMGTGTDMRPIKLPLEGYHLVIAKPQGFSIPTKEAYAGITPARPAVPLEQLLQLPVAEWQGRVKNDFQPVVFSSPSPLNTCPELYTTMLGHGAVYASLSGSGSSVYGLFSNAEQADACLVSLPDTAIAYRCTL
ncbi:MAG: 4-(cytidine 5'-diphospho)-2-C-methyl-D-erythritol kinase [Bacteroidales bacterium]|nr:4-(cytidine 5'-diphospho)-2-C-methyl-D-erythritol kinase [Bacteroidales bacterium]